MMCFINYNSSGDVTMSKRIENKVSIITGSGNGMGKATALLFAEEGAKVVVTDLNVKAGQAVADQINASGGDAIFIKCDISQEDEVKNLVDKTMGKYGRIDILDNNAGVATAFQSDDFKVWGGAWELPLKDWNKMLSINLNGMYLVSHYVIPIMIEQKSGTIVNISSSNALMAVPNSDSYTAAKGGIVSLSRVLAARLGQYNIRVNCICPGYVKTPLHGERWEKLDDDPGTKALLATFPIARIGTPEDIAKAVLFFASDDSSYVTGATLPLDGGWGIV